MIRDPPQVGADHVGPLSERVQYHARLRHEGSGAPGVHPTRNIRGVGRHEPGFSDVQPRLSAAMRYSRAPA